MSESKNPADDNYRFKPLPKQKKFIESTAEQVLLSGSFGAGKSRIGSEKGYLLNQIYPGNRGLIVRKHFTDVKSSTVEQTLLSEVIPESQVVSHNKSEHKIEHVTDEIDPEGEIVTSEIHYHGLDSGSSSSDDDLPRKIGSTSWGWVFVDEATELSRGEWNQLQGRLRYDGKMQGGQYYPVPIRQIFGATNPASPQHFLHEIFIEEGRGDHYSMSVKENPHVPEDYVNRLERELSGMYYERYVEGSWVGAEGMIFSEWDLETHRPEPDELPGACGRDDCDDPECNGWHVIRESEYEDGVSYWVNPPESWAVYRTIDFGYRNPMVVQWWARSPDDTFVMFRELYKTSMLVDDAADRINKLTDEDWDVQRTLSDHDAEHAEQLHQNGIHTENANKKVATGIQKVKKRMMLDERGRPGLYIMKGARVHPVDQQLMMDDLPTRTVDEIPEYVWQNSGDKDAPKKENDHGCDAMRYLIATIDEGSNITREEMERWNDLVQQGF